MDLQERWERVEEVFHAALSQEPSCRDDFLSRTCAADPDLLAEVRSLISAHEQSGSFINTPAYELMADRLVESDSQAYLGQTLGHYTILAHLGRGGMGDVYLAQDSRLDRKVALKVLAAPSPEGGAVLLRFMTEAKAASSLNHPNIITIYDAGQEGASHYIATELIDGQTLRHKMQATRLGLHEALQIAIQVAGALAEAHAAGIVHRDVKPENIMIRRDGLVKVLDFGLATHRTIAPAGIATRAEPLPARDSATDTLAGTIMGTINYMSPEQARGEAVDGRSDVFSLGVVLYEMTTGRRPFEGETDLEAIQSIAEF
ncbi:MAG TPA: serine/threonine-protein kinase, partial [Blastocatellia bacterium]|nr:serine/threonine-protein kinase [Blastocatellia bacterium]